jgi:hypothetical protein
MSSKSKKAVLVREYYYELEQILDKYKDYIINLFKVQPSDNILYKMK